jgi:hypothetical protein
MKRALRSALLIAGAAMAGGKKLHPEVAIDDPPTNDIEVRANCRDADDAAEQVLTALGFKWRSAQHLVRRPADGGCAVQGPGLDSREEVHLSNAP